MNLLKLFTLILFYFLSRAAMAETCEKFKSLSRDEIVCWNDSLKGWISKSCQDGKCEAMTFLKDRKVSPPESLNPNGENPAAKLCQFLNLKVDIFRDSDKNERSFCIFKDDSIIEAQALRRKVL